MDSYFFFNSSFEWYKILHLSHVKLKKTSKEHRFISSEYKLNNQIEQYQTYPSLSTQI